MSRRRFEAVSGSLANRVLAGLAKIGLALKHRAWVHAGQYALTPTQAQILAALATSSQALSLKDVADRLGITAPTASEAVQALVRKELVRKGVVRADARRRRMFLTAKGRRVARQVAGWPDFLAAGVGALTAGEQTALFRALVKVIRTLQARGEIPVSRMCVTCRYFRPYVHSDPARPHHCAFVDAAFGEQHLRLDCSDHEAADPTTQLQVWARFATVPRN